MVQFVFFDFDGVLVKSEQIHYRCWKEVLSNIGVNLLREDYSPLKGKITDEIASILIKKKAIKQNKEILILLKRNLFQKKLSSIKVNESILKVVNYCRTNNIPMGVVTASTKSNAVSILQSNDMIKDFKFVIGREDTKRNKPYPDLYIKGLQLAKIGAKKTIAIEDSRTGYMASITAGIPSIFYNTNSNLIESCDKHVLTSCNGSQIIKYIKNRII
jgi:beta-phosphoglucomutase-like phosphatase (HAD superfamily)